jgi:hypothetical protein
LVQKQKAKATIFFSQEAFCVAAEQIATKRQQSTKQQGISIQAEGKTWNFIQN